MNLALLKDKLYGTLKETLENKDFLMLSFGVAQGITPDKKKNVGFWMFNHDFALEDKDKFFWDEFMEIDRLGDDMAVDGPGAHDWRWISGWATRKAIYLGITKFNFIHDGHTYEKTMIPQAQLKHAEYWSTTEDGPEKARAALFHEHGFFHTEPMLKTEGRRARLLIDPYRLDPAMIRKYNLSELI